MDISVITPAYNCKSYVDKAISSVKAQEGVDYELIIVDDGSTDGTSALLDNMSQKENWIKVIHKENEGPGIARNAALDIAAGKYVFFLDSDDWIAPGSLKYLFELAERKKADIICYGVKKTSSREYELPTVSTAKDREYIGEEILNTYFRQISATVCKFFRRTIFDSYRFENVAICEDAWSMHLFFSKAKRLIISDALCYAQYIRKDSRSRASFTEKNFISVECGRRMVEFAKEYTPYAYGEALYNLIRRQLKLLFLIRENGAYRDFKKQYLNLINELKEEKNDAGRYKDLHPDVWKRFALAVEHPWIYSVREQCKVTFHKWKER